MDRKKRLKLKADELKDRLEFIEENLPGKEEFGESRVIKKSLYKEFQEAMEIISDISAMVTKDTGKVVKDDYSNIEKLCETMKLDKGLCSALKRANGLRNVLVHEYNGTDDSLAYESINELLPYLKSFMEEVERWLEKNY